MMCKEMWITDVERLEDQFGCGELFRDEFESEMIAKGFNLLEIAEIARQIGDCGDLSTPPNSVSGPSS